MGSVEIVKLSTTGKGATKNVNIENADEMVATWLIYADLVSAQSEANHTTNTLDLGADHGLVTGQIIRIQQAATGDAYRYAYVDGVAGNLVTVIGEPFTDGSRITEIAVTNELFKMTYVFDGSPLNEATADLWKAIQAAGKDFHTGRVFKILALRHILEVADATSGGGLNMTINDVADVFTSESIMDSIQVDSWVSADPANNTVNDTDTIQFKTTSPGTGDQAGLRVDVIGVFI